MRWLVGLVALVALSVGAWTVPSAAHADAAAARAHHEKGRAYFQVSEYRKALEEFKAAHVEKPDPAHLYNIAECYRNLGESKDALIFYHRFLKLAPLHTPGRDSAERYIAELEGAPTAGQASPLAAPPASASLPSSPPPAASGGPVGPVSVAAAPVMPPPASDVLATAALDPDAAPVPARPSRTAAYVVGAASIAALVTGAVFGLRAISKRHESDELCTKEVCTSTRGVELNEQAQTAARVSDIAVGAGLVGAAVATYLLLRSPGGTPPAGPQASTIHFAPEVEPHAVKLALGGSW